MLTSDDIRGTITKVEYEGATIATSNDITAFCNTLTGCSLGAGVERTLVVTTTEGLYTVAVRVIDILDTVDKTKFGVVKNGGIEPWTLETEHEGKANVYHYDSAKEDGTAKDINIWNTRVDFGNAALYGQYGFMTIEVYVAEGSSFDLWLENDAHNRLENDTAIGGAYAYAFDASGAKLTACKTGEWITLAVPTAKLIGKRCSFAQPDNTVCDYYVGAIDLYTKANFFTAFGITIEKAVVDKSTFTVVKNGGVAEPWTLETEQAGKANVYHYDSAKEDGTAEGVNIWNTRVDFGNAALYGQYAYMAIEVYIAAGSSFDLWLEGGTHNSLGNDTAIGGAYAYAFDASGAKLTASKTGEWITLIVPTAKLIGNRCSFAQTDNTVCDYYVGAMTLYPEGALETDFDLT